MKLRVLQTLFPDCVELQEPDGPPLFLFGAGDVGKHLLGSLLHHGIEAAGFVVSGTVPVGARRHGLPLLSLPELLALHRHARVIVASFAFHDEIVKSLREAGFPAGQISVWRAPEYHGTRYALVPSEDTCVSKVPGQLLTRDCLFPWHHLIINASGDVFPCFSLSDRYFGNIHHEIRKADGQISVALDRLLKGDGFKALREGLLTGRLCSMCQDCKGDIPVEPVPLDALKARLERHLGTSSAPGLPVLTRMVIGPTRRCNLSCIYCALSSEVPNPGGGPADFPPEALLGLVRELWARGLRSLWLWWDGEFTLYEGWPEIVNGLALDFPGLELRLTSNFSRPFSGDELRALARFTRIDISCDTMDPELYAWLRRGGSLETLKGNIERLQEVAGGGGPLLVLHGVLTDRVIHRLDAMVDYCIVHGLDLEFDNYQAIPGTRASSDGLLKSLTALEPEAQQVACEYLECVAESMTTAGRRCSFLGDVMVRLKSTCSGYPGI